jgi:hypothetical protein
MGGLGGRGGEAAAVRAGKMQYDWDCFLEGSLACTASFTVQWPGNLRMRRFAVLQMKPAPQTDGLASLPAPSQVSSLLSFSRSCKPMFCEGNPLPASSPCPIKAILYNRKPLFRQGNPSQSQAHVSCEGNLLTSASSCFERAMQG